MALMAFPYSSVLDVTAFTLLGNNTGSAGAAQALTASQVRTLCSLYSTSEVDTLLSGKAAAVHVHAASAITSGTIATARLASGTADATTYLRGDQTWATVTAGVGGSTGANDNVVLRSDGTDGDKLQGSVMSILDDGDIVVNGRIEFDASTGRHGAGRSNAYNTYFLAGEQGLGLAFDGGWGGLKALGGIGDTGAELLSAGGITLKTGTGKGVHIGNGTDPKSVSIYNTYTSTTSYERLEIGWDTNVATINTTAGSAGGTKRGLQICSAITDLLGFFGADPVDQPATVADPSGGSTVDTEARAAIAAIIDALQELGLVG